MTGTVNGGPLGFVQGAHAIWFNVLYEKHWMHFFSVAARITGDREAAEDIVREVFVSLLEKNAGTQIRNVDGYLYQALRLRCFKRLRNARMSMPILKHMERALLENTTGDRVC